MERMEDPNFRRLPPPIDLPCPRLMAGIESREEEFTMLDRTTLEKSLLLADEAQGPAVILSWMGILRYQIRFEFEMECFLTSDSPHCTS